MKMLLLAVAFVGLAVGLSSRPTAAQAPEDAIKLTADSVARVGATMQLRGNVRITDGSATIVADEADVAVSGSPAAPPAMELRGNVRVVFSGHRPAVVESAK